MNASIFHQPRGPRKANRGDAAAYPLMTARILYSLKADAVSGNALKSTLTYFNDALQWFHSAVRERVFLFMLPVSEDPHGNIGRRPDEFRKQAGLAVSQLISLSVADNQAGAAALLRAVRADAERHLVARFTESLRQFDRNVSPPSFGYCLDLLQAGRTFTELLTEPKFQQLCTEVAEEHEIRLRDFARITTGLCS